MIQIPVIIDITFEVEPVRIEGTYLVFKIKFPTRQNKHSAYGLIRNSDDLLLTLLNYGPADKQVYSSYLFASNDGKQGYEYDLSISFKDRDEKKKKYISPVENLKRVMSV